MTHHYTDLIRGLQDRIAVLEAQKADQAESNDQLQAEIESLTKYAGGRRDDGESLDLLQSILPAEYNIRFCVCDDVTEWEWL